MLLIYTNDRHERRRVWAGETDRNTMSNTSIAKKARTKPEADFATWLMMAKLGGFDDLPSNAQSFLITIELDSRR